MAADGLLSCCGWARNTHLPGFNAACEKALSIDLILGNNALERLANTSYQIVIEGTSCPETLSPHHKEEVLATMSTK